MKSDWMDNHLTTTLAVFRIEQDNVAQNTGQIIQGSTDTAYRGVDGTVSKEVKFDINGAIIDNWQMTFGSTRYVATDSDNKTVSQELPRTMLKLFTSYRSQVAPDLTVGDRVNSPKHVYQHISTAYGTWLAEQGSYAVLDLFSRSQPIKTLSIQANIHNLFDKTYNTTVSNTIVDSEPLNFSLSANYHF